MSDKLGGLDFGEGARPGQTGQVIRSHPETRKRHLDNLIWGLLRHDTPDPAQAIRPIHARAETVAELPVFRSAFRSRRAIAPADEYFQRSDQGAGPRFAIRRRDKQPLAMAALWESFVWPDGRVERTYCLITVPAVGEVADIHDRMPLVLEKPEWPLWLGEVAGDPSTLLDPDPDILTITRISPPRR